MESQIEHVASVDAVARRGEHEMQRCRWSLITRKADASGSGDGEVKRSLWGVMVPGGS